MFLIEGTHYTRRLEQPLPTSKPSKKIVDCLLCGDPTLDPEEEHDAKERARSKGRNIRLDRLMRHITRDHPDVVREGSWSLISLLISLKDETTAAAT